MSCLSSFISPSTLIYLSTSVCRFRPVYFSPLAPLGAYLEFSPNPDSIKLRLCSLTLSRLVVLKTLGSDLASITIAVKMQVKLPVMSLSLLSLLSVASTAAVPCRAVSSASLCCLCCDVRCNNVTDHELIEESIMRSTTDYELIEGSTMRSTTYYELIERSIMRSTTNLKLIQPRVQCVCWSLRLMVS
ncbi:hypothetical protein J6590_032066 [Homalodisca vitripennis]|nr:hypothetical protein J6590_032066 [Homalodisca vitripennis]